MKKNLLLILMAVVTLPSMLLAQQQTLTVADGTDTEERLPFFAFFADYDQHSQMIYPASMLTALQGTQILSLTFYSNDPSSFDDFTVKLGETSVSNFNSETFVTSATTTVYSGTITIANGMMTINFTAPYSYQGGNLLVDFSNVGVDFGEAYFTGVEVTSGGMIEFDGEYEVVDFLPKLTFTYSGSSCVGPSDFSAFDVNAQSATLSWMAGGSEPSWDIFLTTSGTDIPTENTVPTYTSNDTAYSLTGLNPSTRYYAYVRANCDSGDVSSWMATNFLTSQIPAQLPYVSDFENAAENSLWSIQNNGNNGWYIGAAVNTTTAGQNALYISNDNGVSNAYTYAGESTAWAYRDIDFGTHVGYNISFKYRNQGTNDYYDYLKVYIGSPAEPVASGAPGGTGCTPANATLLGTYTRDSTWQVADIELSSNYSGVQRLYFFWWNDFSGGSNPPAAIDDISVIAVGCGAPVSVVFDSTTTTSCAFHFVPAVASDTAWEAMIYSDTDTVSAVINSTAYTFTNLTPNTQYYIKVRTVCGGGEFSAWRGPVSARTQCAAEVAPYVESFDNFANNPSPCWHKYSVLASSVFSGAESLADNATAYGWYFSSDYVFSLGHPKVNIYSTNTKYWLVSPEIDLSALTIPTLTFDLALTNYSSEGPISSTADVADDKFMVIISTDGGATWSQSNATIWSDDATIADYPFSTIGNVGQEVEIDLYQYAGQTINIAFYAESTVAGGDNDLHIANVNVGESTHCAQPAEIYVDNITTSEVAFSWSPVGRESSWEYLCVPQGTNVDEAAATWMTANDTTATITNLDANTAYTLYVRSYCSAVAQSAAVTADFRTDCGIPSGLVASNVTAYTFDITFSPAMPTDTAWEYVVCAAGANLDNETPTSISDTAFTAAGLNSNTLYDVYVRTVCDSTNFSAWSDAIQVSTIPSCLTPTNLVASDVTYNSVTLSWTEMGSATQWNVKYGPTGFDPETAGTTVAATTSTYTLTGLDAETSYDVYVQADCGDGDVSDTIMASFTTETEPCWAPSDLAVSDIHNHDVTLSWTENGTATNWTIYYRVHEDETSEWSTQTVTTNPYTLIGLDGLTEYDFQVASNCADDVTSDPSAIVNATTLNVGIEDYDAATVIVFPNPTTGMVQVSSSKCQVSGVEIYDVYGKLLKAEVLMDNNTVDMRGCAAGVYFLRVSTENGVVTKRIVKK
ncbi:MAG: fibronectin type III domain-containing protein [Bacteroidales bacterium]|nr:fibronectin type III domain-containing protein [Bacteroidales bacterium]